MPGPTYEEYVQQEAAKAAKDAEDPYSPANIEAFKQRRIQAGDRIDQIQEDVKTLKPSADIGPKDLRRQRGVPVNNPTGASTEPTGPAYEDYLAQELAKQPKTAAQKNKERFTAEHPIIDKAMDIGSSALAGAGKLGGEYIDAVAGVIPGGKTAVEFTGKALKKVGDYTRGAVSGQLGKDVSAEELAIMASGGQEKWDKLDRDVQAGRTLAASMVDPSALIAPGAKVVGKGIAQVAKKLPATAEAAAASHAEQVAQAAKVARAADEAQAAEHAAMNAKAVNEAHTMVQSKIITPDEVTAQYAKVTAAGNPTIDATPYKERLLKLKSQQHLPGKWNAETEKMDPHPSTDKQIVKTIDHDLAVIEHYGGEIPFAELQNMQETYGRLGAGPTSAVTGIYKQMAGGIENSIQAVADNPVPNKAKITPQATAELKKAQELYKKKLGGDELQTMLMDATPLKGEGVTEGLPKLDKLGMMNGIRTNERIAKSYSLEDRNAMIDTLRKIELPVMSKLTPMDVPGIDRAVTNPVMAHVLKEGAVKIGQAAGIPSMASRAVLASTTFLLTTLRGRKMLESMAEKSKGPIRPSAIIAAAEAIHGETATPEQ